MQQISRRELLVGGAAALGVLAADGCNLNNNPSGAFANNFVNRYDLTVQYADHSLGGFTLRTRTYNGTIPGPTLYAFPGQPFNVGIDNQLPPNPAAPFPSNAIVHPMASMDDMGMVRGRGVLATHIDPMNNPHEFNTTNLHVHGLQVIPHLFEPLGTSDPASMMIAITPGTKRLYTFVLPPDHPSGLYWYHPHHHGATHVQASGGMAGPIIVRGPIDQVPEIAAARDIPVVIQSLEVNPDRNTPGIYSTEYVAYQPPGPPTYGYTPRTSDIFMLVNGQLVNHITGLLPGTPPGPSTGTPYPPPQVQMQPGEVVRLRILNGTNALNLPIKLPGFEVYVIGIDGVNFLAPQKIDQSTSSESIASANRIEMLVRAPAVAGTYTLSALSTQETVHVWPQFDLMQFVVAGASKSMSIPAALPTPTRLYPLIADNEIVANRTVTFSAAASSSMLNGTALMVNGKQYDEMEIMFNLRLGTAEQWTIVNTMGEGHPFHIHTNSFEVHSVTGPGATVTNYSPPFLADTIWVPGNGGQVVMRTRFKSFAGKTVFHCHKLPHEDQGMMANIIFS